MTVVWGRVTRTEVLRAIQEYDQLPKAILGTAYEFATGQRLASGDFEGGKTGAVKVLRRLGFTVESRRPTG